MKGALSSSGRVTTHWASGGSVTSVLHLVRYLQVHRLAPPRPTSASTSGSSAEALPQPALRTNVASNIALQMGSACAPRCVCVPLLFQLISWCSRSTAAGVREVGDARGPAGQHFQDAFVCLSVLSPTISRQHTCVCVRGVHMGDDGTALNACLFVCVRARARAAAMACVGASTLFQLIKLVLPRQQLMCVTWVMRYNFQIKFFCSSAKICEACSCTYSCSSSAQL